MKTSNEQECNELKSKFGGRGAAMMKACSLKLAAASCVKQVPKNATRGTLGYTEVPEFD